MNILSFLLLICPYVFFALIGMNLTDAFLLYFALAIVIGISNIIYSSIKESESYKKLAVNGMIVKTFHIPYYIISFFCAFALVKPTDFDLAALSVFSVIIVIINFFLMITSSSYGINSLIRLKKNDKITNSFLVVNIIMHLIFVLDFISSIIVFSKCKKVDKETK